MKIVCTDTGEHARMNGSIVRVFEFEAEDGTKGVLLSAGLLVTSGEITPWLKAMKELPFRIAPSTTKHLTPAAN